VQNGTLTAAKADELTKQVADEMEQAVGFALKSPFPKLESAAALEYNYA
jgi:TPP-dependent pyruvate/acetoin dehydrogenase alpha subunit